MALGISSVGLTGGLAGASASLTYKNLVSKYQGFSQPEAWVEFNGKPFNDSSIIVTDINVEATCGFEASVARLRLYLSLIHIWVLPEDCVSSGRFPFSLPEVVYDNRV